MVARNLGPCPADTVLRRRRPFFLLRRRSLRPDMNSPRDPHARLRRYFSDLQSRTPGLASFALNLPGQPPCLLGNGSSPSFTITCHNQDAVAAILSNDETRIALAYVNGA